MLFDFPECGGCRTCEMACSFHHMGKFNPSVSSIRIIEKERGTGFEVVLYEERDGEAFSCDLCAGDELPSCVQYCCEAGGLTGILEEFRKRKIARG
jgi:Fe-S-cluster-containing dehydrogenase component